MEWKCGASSCHLPNKKQKDDTTMTRQEKIAQFEKMLRRAPEIMSPLKVAKFSLFGKNKVYELIKTKQLKRMCIRTPT